MKINIIGSIGGYRKIFAEDYKLMKKEREDKNYTRFPLMAVDSTFKIENYMLIMGGQELLEAMNSVGILESYEVMLDSMLAYIDKKYYENIRILFDTVSSLLQTKENAEIKAEFWEDTERKLITSLEGLDINELRGLLCSCKGTDFYIQFCPNEYMLKILCDGKTCNNDYYWDRSFHNLDYNLNKFENNSIFSNNPNIEVELDEFIKKITAL